MNRLMHYSPICAALGLSASLTRHAMAQTPSEAPLAPAPAPAAAPPAAAPATPSTEPAPAPAAPAPAAPAPAPVPSDSPQPLESEPGAETTAAAEVSSDGATGSAVASETGTGLSPATSSAESTSRAFRHDRESEFENGHVFVAPKELIEFHGTMQVDTGFLGYDFFGRTSAESVYDLRGRFVLGPTLWHQFGDDWFVRARAEFVAWLREINQSYQVNVDDAFVQFGQIGRWDLKVGRFFSWRVYHRGPGFDLFTAEDLGACQNGDCAAQDPSKFGPRMYDVSNIYFRDTPGRAALHFYPTEWSGIEALVQYGSYVPTAGAAVQNSLGGRLAAIVQPLPLLRVSLAGEARQNDPTADLTQPAQGGGTIPCPTCSSSSDVGFGGGAELTLKEVGLELAGNVGYSERTAYAATESRVDLASSGQILSFGGYGQFDLGKHVFQKSLVLGAGYNYTQSRYQNDDYDRHGQLAAYLLWPLEFFQGAALKLVYTNAQLSSETGTNAVIRQDSNANSVRLRLSVVY